MPTFRAVAALVVTAACGGHYTGGTPAQKPAPPGPKVGLDAAALPYQILDRHGAQVDEAAFWDKVTHAHAVCVGEEHPNPHHHWVQLHVVRTLAKRIGKDKLAIGLEMVQRPFQAPLDDYSAHRIDAEALLALNAAKELTKKVVRQGLESLTADEKKDMPDLDLKNEAHRAWFDNLMNSMGGTSPHSKKAPDKDSKDSKPDDKKDDKDKVPNPHKEGNGEMVEMPSADRIYTAQVIWDETMADTASKWVKANPTGHLVILAGNGHCHDSAIVNRMKRRGVADAMSIRVVIDDPDAGESVADILAKPMNDYVVVLKLPKQEPTVSALRTPRPPRTP
jgi:hypothetical protein